MFSLGRRQNLKKLKRLSVQHENKWELSWGPPKQVRQGKISERVEAGNVTLYGVTL